MSESMFAKRDFDLQQRFFWRGLRYVPILKVRFRGGPFHNRVMLAPEMCKLLLEDKLGKVHQYNLRPQFTECDTWFWEFFHDDTDPFN